MPDFLSIESLGVAYTAKCGGSHCGSCPTGGKEYTLKEERELNLIPSNLMYAGDHWIVKYPWIKETRALPDNYGNASKTEKRLCTDPDWQQTYSEQIEDMVKRKVARKLPVSEIKSYNGPIHYIAPCRHETGMEIYTCGNCL